MGRHNVCLMAYDDLSDLSPTSFFRDEENDVRSYQNQGAFCDFVSTTETLNGCPSFDNFTNQDTGRRVFGFYKDVFMRLYAARSVEELKSIKDSIQSRFVP